MFCRGFAPAKRFCRLPHFSCAPALVLLFGWGVGCPQPIARGSSRWSAPQPRAFLVTSCACGSSSFSMPPDGGCRRPLHRLARCPSAAQGAIAASNGSWGPPPPLLAFPPHYVRACWSRPAGKGEWCPSLRSGLFLSAAAGGGWLCGWVRLLRPRVCVWRPGFRSGRVGRASRCRSTRSTLPALRPSRRPLPLRPRFARPRRFPSPHPLPLCSPVDVGGLSKKPLTLRAVLDTRFFRELSFRHRQTKRGKHKSTPTAPPPSAHRQLFDFVDFRCLLGVSGQKCEPRNIKNHKSS